MKDPVKRVNHSGASRRFRPADIFTGYALLQYVIYWDIFGFCQMRLSFLIATTDVEQITPLRRAIAATYSSTTSCFWTWFEFIPWKELQRSPVTWWQCYHGQYGSFRSVWHEAGDATATVSLHPLHNKLLLGSFMDRDISVAASCIWHVNCWMMRSRG